MPGTAAAGPAILDEHLFCVVPNVFGTPEFGVKVREGHLGDEVVELVLGVRVRVVDVRLQLGTVKPVEHVRTRVGDAPEKCLVDLVHLLRIQPALDQRRPLFAELLFGCPVDHGPSPILG